MQQYISDNPCYQSLIRRKQNLGDCSHPVYMKLEWELRQEAKRDLEQKEITQAEYDHFIKYCGGEIVKI
jgi:hypothetical protein